MIKAIDSHTHFNHGSIYDTKTDEIYKTDIDTLLKINSAAGIDKMFCSTFASVINPKYVVEENEYLYRLATDTDYLYQWVVIDPRNAKTFCQARKILNTDKCVGIKLHPLNHNYSFSEYGDEILKFASEYSAIIQIHPETDADYILPYADKYPEVIFIIAHLGSYNGKCYADAIERAKYGNVYTDTSGIASSKNQVIEYTVGRVGSEKILFGTDTYAAGFQRGRIEYALISQKDKENILRNNSKRLFGKFF